MSETNSWWALLAIIVTTAGGVATAWLGGRERRQEVEVSGGEAPELADSDLSTITGLAAALTQQSSRITILEAGERDTRERLAALWRYIRLLRSTIRGLGAPVPEPDPEDKHLIEQ